MLPVVFPDPLKYCIEPTGPYALPSALPESPQSIYAQPNLAMGYPTPDEPDQLGPFEPLHLVVSIEVSPATISTVVEVDSQISVTLSSNGPSTDD